MKHKYLKIALLVFITTTACKSAKKRGITPPPPTVEVQMVESEMLSNNLEFVGVISSSYDVEIQPRIDGYLTEINYKKGMPVKKGQILYKIDPKEINTEIAEARSLVETANAELIEAENNYNRAVPLAKISAISQSQLDQYEAQYKSASASLVSAKAKLKNATINLGYTTIRSPIDGIIGDTDLAIGQYVGPSSANSTLNTISNIENVDVALSIPMPQYLEVVKESGADRNSYNNEKLLSNIKLYLSDGSQYPYEGEYLYTQKDVGSQMGTLEVVVRFSNPQRALKVGQYAKVVANMGELTAKNIVPQVAVTQSQDIDNVWIVGADTVAQFRKVALGNTIGDMWIINDGVSEGERVIVSGQTRVRNGEKVAIK